MEQKKPKVMKTSGNCVGVAKLKTAEIGILIGINCLYANQ